LFAAPGQLIDAAGCRGQRVALDWEIKRIDVPGLIASSFGR